MNIGDKIYYTGDMANISGWFEVKSLRSPSQVDLAEIDGDRNMRGIHNAMIGTEYCGHCGTRFVTEAAYRKYSDEALARFNRYA